MAITHQLKPNSVKLYKINVKTKNQNSLNMFNNGKKVYR